jgi:DUF1680 family protein
MQGQSVTRREFLRTAGRLAAASGFTGAATLSALPQVPQPVSPRFQWLRLGQVMPAGWIKAQLQMDLREGFAGKLDQLAPAEVATDIYCSGRNQPSELNSPTVQTRWAHTWWNGESEGNWRTGYIMMAYLSDESEAKRKADVYVRHILQGQDADGYIGVYSPALRYSQNPENGELWTQTCILRGLVAYYELTGDPAVLEAAERAVQRTISNYGPGKQTAFMIPVPGDGIAHGLMFTDVLERLFDLTGKNAYRDFGLWMYQDFCAGIASLFSDATLAALLDLNKPLMNHGVHTYECIRVPLWAYFVSGKPDLKQAYENAFIKAGRYTYPSGAAVSMEYIVGRKPDPTETFYEYCAMKELLATYSSGLQKTGEAELADRVERLIFNAAQGARAAGGKAITYCTSDNRYRVDGGLKRRIKFSPAHADCAVCCNPNATQIMALYTRGMWMRTLPEQGLAATLYGPCSVNTQVRGVNVHIEEETHYPFSGEIAFTFTPQKPVDFPLLLRNPGWSENTRVTCEGAIVRRDGGYFVVHKLWQKGDRVTVAFSESIAPLPAANGEVAIQRGPLVYALKIPADERKIKTYALPGFADSEDFPSPGAQWSYALDATQSSVGFGLAASLDKGANMRYPYEGASLRLVGNLLNLSTGKPEPVGLIPVGSSQAVLRRETFPVKN